MSEEVKLQKILVVLNSDLVESGSVHASSLLRRSLELAKTLESQLELFYVCHDLSLEQKLFTSADEVAERRESLASSVTEHVAKLVAEFGEQGIKVEADICWDQPEAIGVLEKINKNRPDLVMKRMAARNYFLGLNSNTDWELIRRSTAHVWFVEDSIRKVSRIISAIGTTAPDEEIISAADHEVFNNAQYISNALGAELVPVHAYQIPDGVNAYASYEPRVGEEEIPIDKPAYENLKAVKTTSKRVAESHGKSIRAFAEVFDIDPGKVKLVKGDPGEVLPEMAREIDADLVVMGARNLDRLERLLASVTAEPSLAETPCDILYIKSMSESEVSELSPKTVQDMVGFDMEQAITHPASSFDSPSEVVDIDQVSVALRRRILDLWEQDVRASLANSSDKRSSTDIDPSVLRDIEDARNTLAKKQS